MKPPHDNPPDDKSPDDKSPDDESAADPLAGKTLEAILEALVARHGWAGLAEEMNIRCFATDPSVPSSLKFLRMTPWARAKVERFYREDQRVVQRNAKRNKRRAARRAYRAACEAGDAPEAHLPEPVSALLAWWLPRVKDLLGPAYQSALLFGSAVANDFQPAWSDVDVCIALARPLVDTEVEDLGALQEETDQAFVEDGEQGWLSEQTVDPVYVLASDLAQADAEAPGTYDRLALSTQMRLLDGLPVEIAPPDAAALAQARALFLEELRTTAADATPMWHADAIGRLACAVVRAESDGSVTTTLALERLLAEEDSLAGAWQLALEVRRAGSAQAEEQGDELAAAFQRVHAAAVARIEFLTR